MTFFLKNIIKVVQIIIINPISTLIITTRRGSGRAGLAWGAGTSPPSAAMAATRGVSGGGEEGLAEAGSVEDAIELDNEPDYSYFRSVVEYSYPDGGNGARLDLHLTHRSNLSQGRRAPGAAPGPRRHRP